MTTRRRVDETTVVEGRSLSSSSSSSIMSPPPPPPRPRMVRSSCVIVSWRSRGDKDCSGSSTRDQHPSLPRTTSSSITTTTAGSKWRPAHATTVRFLQSGQKRCDAVPKASPAEQEQRPDIYQVSENAI
ncbi:uncharacterized protein [Dermacentor albipictus]|uniref:uncharacterized protein isoform X1 n=1 Tax=Dermacentor albipictus TaxID=60249 RepID=UPI0038FC4774